MNSKTPAEAAYEAWTTGTHARRFNQLSAEDRLNWEAVADAVIAQSKSLIVEEMAKAIFTNNDAEKMSALMWYAGKRTVQQRLDDDGKRAAKALRAVITQQPSGRARWLDRKGHLHGKRGSLSTAKGHCLLPKVE